MRYRAPEQPSRTVVCHCTFCQRVTGSAFAVWPSYAQETVQMNGALSSYEHRSDESGRWIRVFFCPRCGTSIASTFEKGPGQIALLAGTFDDTAWITVDRHVWTRSAQRWFVLPESAVRFERGSTG